MRASEASVLQLLRFGTVGLLNTVVDYIVFILLTWAGLPVLLSQVISYSCGTVNSYLLNSSWTFRTNKQPGEQKSQQVTKFIVINLIVLGLTAALLEVIHRITTLSLPYEKLIATIAGMAINYIGSRYWVFRFSQ